MCIDVISAGGLPYLYRAVAVITPGSDVLPVRRPCNATYKADMATIGHSSPPIYRGEFVSPCIPNMHSAIRVPRCNRPPVGGPCQGQHTTVVAAIDDGIFP